MALTFAGMSLNEYLRQKLQHLHRQQQQTNNTHMVSQAKIDEAKSRSIVPGATIKCAAVTNRIGIVMPTAQWTTEISGAIDVGRDDRGEALYGYSGRFGRWAEVITPAPGSMDCLRPKDSVKASGAMIAALADRAVELGLLNRKYASNNGQNYIGSGSVHWAPDNLCTFQVGYEHVNGYNLLSPAEFLRRMENTRRPEEKIVIKEGWAEHAVQFNKGSITVGCATITNDVVRKIASKLKD